MRARAAAVSAALLLAAAAPAAALSVEQPAPVELFTFTDPRIDESSGLVDLGDLLVTVNDSGDDAIVYVIDRETGDTVGTTRFADSVVDVEALAPAGRGRVWVADIGDNSAQRPDVAVYRVPVGRGDRTVTAPRHTLVYPDRPQDAEALLAHPRTGRLYVVTKGLFGGTLYAAPRRLRTDGPNRLRALARAGAVVTDGAFTGDGRHVILRDYGRGTALTFPDLDRVARIALPRQEQGEGLSVGPGNRVHVSTEGQYSAVHEVPLAPALAAELAPQGPGDTDPGGEQTEGPADGPLDEAGGEAVEEPADPEPPADPTVDSGWLRLGVAVLLGLLALWLVGRRTRH
ncbi:MAG: hypothetical protein Q8Q02_12940 [Nocardioides sp.]|nr:hypothetical protein [Nocardioides sp.]